MSQFLDAILRRNVFMAKYGDVVFSTERLSFQEVKRKVEAKINTYETLNGKVINQFISLKEEKLTMNGLIFPEYHQSAQQRLESLYTILREGKPQLLSLTSKESSFPTGLWLIERIEETQNLFRANGEAQKIQFSLDLIRSET
jgi:hypothetical protein